MMDILDFSSSQQPSPGEFFSRVTIMMIAWIFAIATVERISKAVAAKFWSHSIPIDKASIPSKLPHPNPPGGAIPFDIPLTKATDEQIEAFVKFRGLKVGHQKKDKKVLLQLVADSVAGYKGLLYQERIVKWIDDHFRLRKPGLQYPYVGRHWNGWRSFYTETGPIIRKMFIACTTVIFEHTINGLVLPGLYLITRDDIYCNLALYGEVGFMIYASIMIIASFALHKDVTIEQQHESVWGLILVHHIASLFLCVVCIIQEGVPKDLICSVLLVLVGLTSSLHYVGVILDLSPLAQSNTPYIRLCNHIVCLASQITFRCIYWVHLVYSVIIHCLETHGTGTAVAVALSFLLFTLFNIDFIKFHVKATQGCWSKIQQEKFDKVC